MNDRIVAALDAYKISDPAAMHVISAVVQALGYSLDDLVISVKSINRHRKTNRKEITAAIKTTFKV